MAAPLASLAAESPVVREAYDTSTADFAAYVDHVEDVVDSGEFGTASAIDETVRSATDDVIGLRVALKVVQSRSAIRALDEPMVVTLLNPVYKETGRILPRSQHPHGEDSIRYKADALDRISRLNPRIQTRLMVIDDGCPQDSGAMAAAVLSDLRDWEDRYEVLFLEDARRAGDPDVPPGLTAKDGDRRSVKGGAVLFGMRRALQLEPGCRHVIVDNDADLSVLPDQLGLLLERIVDDGFDVVAGSRREDDSVAIIEGSRAGRGSLFIRIWQHLLPQLAEQVIDTNRAFKAFDSDALARIIDDIEIYTFPYQVELLQAGISKGLSLTTRGIAYIDSEAASTQQGDAITESYIDQVRQIIDIATRYGTVDADDPLMRFFDGVDDETWLEFEQNPTREFLEIVEG